VIANDSKGGVVGKNYVGGIAGNAEGGRITDVYFKGIVRGSDNVGGIIGQLSDSVIHNSHFNGVLEGRMSVGGISGLTVYASKVRKSYSLAKVKGVQYVGGVIGSLGTGGLVEGSYFNGEVSGINLVGGIIGLNRAHAKCHSLSGVFDSYSVGKVSGRFFVGGIAGYLFEAKIYTSYSLSEVSGKHAVGGIAGSNTGDIVDTYFAGKLNGMRYVGGIAGYSSSMTGSMGIIARNYFSGVIDGGEYVGGIVGYADSFGIYDNLVTGSFGEGELVDRVIARIKGKMESDYPDFNFALSTLKEGFANFFEGNFHTGVSKTAEELKQKTTYTAPPPKGLGWRFGNDRENPWTFEGSTTGYPILYWQDGKTETPSYEIICEY
jgi:hypothetical protein